MATATAKKPGKAGKQPAKGSAKGAKAPKATRAPKAAKPAPEPTQADFLGTESSNVVDLGAGVKVREATAAEVADFMGSAGDLVENTTQAVGHDATFDAGPEELPADYVAPGLTHHSGDMYADENGVLVDRFGRELFPPEDETQDPGESGEVVELAPLDEVGEHIRIMESEVEPEAPAPASIGHNNPPSDEDEAREAAAGQLKAFVERIERLDDEAAVLAEDRKEVFAELKGAGFDTKVVRKIIALKKRDAAQLAEENTILQLYAQALGLDFLV